MARPKKATAKSVEVEVKPKEKKIVMTKEQFESLKAAAEVVSEARRVFQNIEGAETLSAISFAAGRIYEGVNTVEDTLDDLIDELEPDDYDVEY